MPRTVAPCKGCNDRNVGCHSICTKYKEYERTNEFEREAIRNTSGYVIPKGSWTGDEGLVKRHKR